jgi:RNA polymerase sigma-70 factor (ECF subfamily)
MVRTLRIMSSRASRSDEEAAWIDAARAGDRAAFDQLVRLHFARIYGLLFRMLGNHEDAEDLAQDCFVRAFGAIRFYRGESAFSTWLFRIALHLARDHGRRRQRAHLVGLEPLSAEPAGSAAREPSQELSRRETVAALSQAIKSLPHNLRAAVVLRLLEGMQYDEIARATGMRPGTVRTQVMKARRILLRVMAPWMAPEERDVP